MSSAPISAPAIEARSLSSLTALASNPPAYPRNPTHLKHEPLVLYIARVPGSKDVFLSPMKPRDKVVTAEDIQSSLYFIHVEQPEDAHLVEPPSFQEPDYTEYSAPPVSTSAPLIQRKALPGAQPMQGHNGALSRKPVPSTLAPIKTFDNRQNISAGAYSQKHGMLGPDYNARRSFDSTQYQNENKRSSLPQRRSYDRSRLVGTCLTLIRRDPASGAQWNVARIEDPPVLEVSSSSHDQTIPKRKPGSPMYLEILNPGYSKFLHFGQTGKPVSEESHTGFPSNRNPQVSGLTALEVTRYPETGSAMDQNTFRRRIWMEGSQHSNNGFGHRKNSSYDLNTAQLSGGSYDKALSGDRPAPPPSFLARNDQSYSTIQVSDRQTSFRGYVFTSPWNGRCEFITGSGGGSLKCRHIIPGPQGAAPMAMSVSELRFNLPGSSMPLTPKPEETLKRSSFFHRGRHSRNNSSLSVNKNEVEEARDSMDRLDLSLGQELAGGGFGGKQAKLGKIILEDEGLKMMDLLVAANLGLWWRAYGKASGGPGGDRGNF